MKPGLIENTPCNVCVRENESQNVTEMKWFCSSDVRVTFCGFGKARQTSMGMDLQVKQHNPTKACDVLLVITRIEEAIHKGERFRHRRATVLERKRVEGGQ